MNKKIIALILIFLFVVAVATKLIIYNNKNKTNDKNAKASSSNIDFDSWSGGILDNSVIVSGDNSLSVNNLRQTATQIDLSEAIINANKSPENASNAIDGNASTAWGPVELYGSQYISIDLGSSNQIFRITITGACGTNALLTYSQDGSSFLPVNHDFSGVQSPSYTCSATHDFTDVISARYLNINLATVMPGSYGQLYDVSFFAPSAIATHTTAPSQIDGTSDFYEWEEFTPTQSVPANTTVSYRFRSSPDYSSWTSWTDSQTYSGTPLNLTSLVTSRATVGEATTYYRYLQIETTLTSSDGVANPSISDYTIDYHTNVKPNKPTAQTAVVGS